MKRTTIFLPDDLRERLRVEAFRARVSMAELIRSRLQGSTSPPKKSHLRGDPILSVAGACSGPILSEGIDQALYGE
jgi:hypothetical protein